MAKRVAKTSVNELRRITGWMTLVGWVVLIFALGVIAGVAYCSRDTHHHHDVSVVSKDVEVKGSDGLMGLVGYGDPFEEADKINYVVTYKNESTEDRLIEIKATQYSRNPVPVKDSPRVDVGSVTGVLYSDKAMVKAGESKKFYVTLVQTKDEGTHYVELEAFKTK